MTLTIDAARYTTLIEENRRLRLCLNAADATILDLQIALESGETTTTGAAYLERLTARLREQA